MPRANKYDRAWLKSRGCPVDVPVEPPSFEVAPDECAPHILVGLNDSILWLWLRIKALRRQKIESISLQLPWGAISIAKELTAFRTEYPRLFMIPDVGEYELWQFLNPYISRQLGDGEELRGWLVA